MNKILKSYLVIIGNIVAGLGILLLFQQLEAPQWISGPVILIIFLLLNLMNYYGLNLNKETLEFWTLKKLHYLFWGTLGGVLISCLPVLLSLFFTKLSLNEIHINSDISFIGVILTLVIVSWEEFWFRGLFLNYCNRYLSVTNLSLTIGFLFLFLHVFNPDIKLINKGPALFFAGTLLVILYFFYKSIWMPIGLHFGNNFISSVIETENKSDILFGQDGYISACILAMLCFLFLVKLNKQETLV